MDISTIQILLLTAYGFLAIWDTLNPNFGFNNPVVAGLFAGIIMGDVTTGLAIGGTLQLMVLGVGTYGGASIPDYMTGAVLGTSFAVTSGQGLEFGLAIAVPVGLLLVQFDVLARFANTFLQHVADDAAEKKDYRKVELGNVLGVIPWGLSRALPIFICLFFGEDLVNSILSASPEWILSGLKVAGGLLPAIGVGILLRYLPVKKYAAYIILGFVAATYMEVEILGVALIGLSAAIIVFNKRKEEGNKVIITANEGGTIEDDE